MTTPAPQQSPAAAGSLTASLNETERLLKDCASRARRGNLFTIVVGVAALIVLGGYFGYGFSQISSVMEPNTLVSVAEGWMEDQLPELRKSLETEVDKSAPVWAESLSKQAQGSLPSIREKLEEYVLQQVDLTVEQTVSLTEEHFRRLLREKRDLLEEGFKDLSTSPELAKESLERLEGALDEMFQTDMKKGADDLFFTLGLMNTKLARLKAGQQLTAEEALERQVLMQFRRLQLEQVETEKVATTDALVPMP